MRLREPAGGTLTCGGDTNGALSRSTAWWIEILVDPMAEAHQAKGDTNLICLVNPDRYDLAAANALGRRVYSHMAIDSSQPLQTRQFIGSRTSIRRTSLSDDAAVELCRAIGVHPDTFVPIVTDPRTQADHVFLIRHTLMNPWLRVVQDGRNYIDRYCEFLEKIVKAEVGDGGTDVHSRRERPPPP